VPRLKCTFREFIQIILDQGFVLVRHDGSSHRIYRGIVEGKPQLVVVAVHHLHDEIKTGTLDAMIRQTGLPKALFRK
jgi:predicted RNA binding protein YcfA (HicA-like mRNA interferase family)